MGGGEEPGDYYSHLGGTKCNIIGKLETKVEKLMCITEFAFSEISGDTFN